MLGPIFDPDAFICIDDYIDSAEVSSRDYSFHYQVDGSLLKPGSISSTLTHDYPLPLWECCEHLLRYGSSDFLATPLLSSIFSDEFGDALVELFNMK